MMKHCLLALLISSVASAATFEPLGQPCRGFNILASRVVKDPAGKEWFVLSNTNETTGVELIFIDFAMNTGKTCRAPAGQGSEMTKLLAFVGATVGSSIGWWIGSRVGILTAFFLSVVGTAVGLYFGRRIGKQYFD